MNDFPERWTYQVAIDKLVAARAWKAAKLLAKLRLEAQIAWGETHKPDSRGHVIHGG